MRGLSTWVIAGWATAFTVLVLNAAVSVYNIEALIEDDRAVSHSRDVRRTMADLMSALKDAETGQRGYIISDRKDYLEPFHSAERLIPEYLNRLHELTADDEYYPVQFEILRGLIEKQLALLRWIIDIHQEGGEDASRVEIRKGDGKKLMDRIRAQIDAMEGHEQQILVKRSETRHVQYQSAVSSALLGGVITVLMVALSLGLVRIELGRRQKAEAATRQALLLLAEEQKIKSEDLARMVKIRTAEFESANVLLREEIAERTRAEARAQAATAELQRSNEELEKFAYVASHDLQEPLRKIQAFGDRLAKRFRDSLGPDGGEYVDRMQAAATRMRTLINDLLTFSRVTTKGQPFLEVDLNTLVGEVLDDLAERIEQTAAHVDVDQLPNVNADALQMRQLFQNLIGNALKFQRPDIPPAITIRAASWNQLPAKADPPAPPGAGHRITVVDNGIGFDQSFAERIFELFQRLHGRGEYEGTGIGLAICRKIVQRHGGTITARSQEGVGTTFIIDLPAATGT
jgi:signal transduction histidine kinase